MTEYRPSQIAELLGISPDTVRRWCDEGRLPSSKTAGGHRIVPGAALAAFLRDRPPAYEAESARHQSARNRFTGVVTRIQRDALVALVEIHAGPHRLVSLMTTEAIDELGLVEGDVAVASVKVSAVMVEVPPRSP